MRPAKCSAGCGHIRTKASTSLSLDPCLPFTYRQGFAAAINVTAVSTNRAALRCRCRAPRDDCSCLPGARVLSEPGVRQSARRANLASDARARALWRRAQRTPLHSFSSRAASSRPAHTGRARALDPSVAAHSLPALIAHTHATPNPRPLPCAEVRLLGGGALSFQRQALLPGSPKGRLFQITYTATVAETGMAATCVAQLCRCAFVSLLCRGWGRGEREVKAR